MWMGAASAADPPSFSASLRQAEYVKEGIDWRHIAFEDNQVGNGWQRAPWPQRTRGYADE